MRKTLRIAAYAVLMLGFCLVMRGHGAEPQQWSQWRGPNRDGVAAGFAEPRTWPDRLTLKWKIETGSGQSSPVVSADRVYVHARVGEDEIVAAHDVATGKAIWQDRFPVSIEIVEGLISEGGRGPAGPARRFGAGPKSTPIVSGGQLFTLGMDGVLSAYDIRTGKAKWRTTRPPVLPVRGTAMSPLVDRGLVIAHLGGYQQGALTALDADTGAVKWRWSGDGPGYASPILVTVDGVRQFVTMSQYALIGIAADSGELLWRRSFITPAEQNIVTSVVYKDLLIYSGVQKGITAIRVLRRDGQWVTEDAWHNADLWMSMSSPVVVDDALYGLSARNFGQYFCLDARTGKTLWVTEGRKAENASLVKAGSVLLLLSDGGELIVAKPNPNAFEPLRRYVVAEGQSWAHPVLDGRRIFIKDDSTLALWSVE